MKWKSSCYVSWQVVNNFALEKIKEFVDSEDFVKNLFGNGAYKLFLKAVSNCKIKSSYSGTTNNLCLDPRIARKAIMSG